MPLIGGRREALAFKDVTEVTPTVTADNLCALHAEGIINMSLHSTGNRIEVSGPATAGLELVIGRVKGRIATSAVIDTRGRVVRVVFTRSCALCAFLSENAKLLCISKQRKHLRGYAGRHWAEALTGIQDRPPLILASLIGVRHVACLVWFVRAEEGAKEWDCWGCSECLRAYCSARGVSD